MKYPVFKPSITDSDKESVINCLEEGWISSAGPYVSEFEENFSKFLGAKYSISVSSGTAALEVALASIGIDSGEVILPSFTIASCAYAIQKVNAKPVFVDIDPDYLSINPDEVEAKINKNTKAIMIVNMYGNTCDVDKFLEIRKKYKIPIIEDCSENLGGQYKNKFSGTQFDISTFSLYANKTITSGEGGIICTSNEKTKNAAIRYRNLDFKGNRNFTHEKKAFNYRLTSPQCALANNQLRRINEILSKKDLIYQNYIDNLNSEKITPIKGRPNTRFVPWMNCFKVSPSVNFNFSDFYTYMIENEIQVRPFFSSLANQEAFKNNCKEETKFPNSQSYEKNGFYLPSSLELSKDDISFIMKIVNNYFN